MHIPIRFLAYSKHIHGYAKHILGVFHAYSKQIPCMFQAYARVCQAYSMRMKSIAARGLRCRPLKTADCVKHITYRLITQRPLGRLSGSLCSVYAIYMAACRETRCLNVPLATYFPSYPHVIPPSPSYPPRCLSGASLRHTPLEGQK